MIRKFVFAAGVASFALSPALAAPKSEAAKAAADAAEAAADAAEAATDAVYVDHHDYGPTAGLENPFAGLEEFALKKPIVDLPKPDPVRLAIAEKVADALYPDGTSQRLFTSLRTDLFQPVFDRFWTMKESEAQQLFSVGKTVAPIPEGRKDETLGEALGDKDPNAKARVEAYVKVYLDLLGEMSTPMDSDWRGAMARDFARRYTAPQLTEMAKFFATPAGRTFGQDYWLSSFSLDLIQTSLMNWPKMMKAVPDFAERLKKADAHLPPAPKGSVFAAPDYSSHSTDLPECAKDGDETDCTDEDWENYDAAAAAVEAAAAAADAAGDAADSGEQRSAWSKADRKAVEAIEKQQDKLWSQHDALDDKMADVETRLNAATKKAKRNAGQPVDEDMELVPVPASVD